MEQLSKAEIELCIKLIDHMITKIDDQTSLIEAALIKKKIEATAPVSMIVEKVETSPEVIPAEKTKDNAQAIVEKVETTIPLPIITESSFEALSTEKIKDNTQAVVKKVETIFENPQVNEQITSIRENLESVRDSLVNMEFENRSLLANMKAMRGGGHILQYPRPQLEKRNGKWKRTPIY